MSQSRVQRFRTILIEGSKSYLRLSFVLFGILLLAGLAEVLLNSLVHQAPDNLSVILLITTANTFLFWLKFLVVFWILHVILHLFSPAWARNISIIIFSILILSHILLIKYFSEALIPLGADVFGYSQDEIQQTLGSSGAFSLSSILTLVITTFALIFGLLKLSRKVSVSNFLAYSLPIVSGLYLISGLTTEIPYSSNSEYASNLSLNKSDFFYHDVLNHVYPSNNKIDIYDDAYFGIYSDNGDKTSASFEYPDRNKYPFLHVENSANSISPFFKKSSSLPNIVIILVEGLGRAFSNENAYLGSFTPFLDSLSNKSLYFSNFLSSGGRTFAALPSVLGSLPFGENGFIEAGDAMPKHLSLLSILKNSGYHTSFYYGGNASFDYMNVFLRKNKIDELHDISTFPAGYTKLPAQNGFSWGYNDKELYRRYFDTRKSTPSSPQLSVILTVSSHSPFLINEQEKYFSILQERLNKLGFDDQKKNDHNAYKYQYSSILYTDDALRTFFNNYKKRQDFNNTIFLITGDHRMPEIPMSNKIDRYHVPLIIYSPLLARSAKIESVSTHFDIAPSLLSFLSSTYNIKIPAYSTWISDGLDTARGFRNRHTIPLMQTKTTLTDYVNGEYHLNNQTLYKLSNNMVEEPVEDKDMFNRINSSFNEFSKRNRSIVKSKSLIPDSLYQKFFPNR